VDSHLSKQGTIHARGRFPGRSPFKTGDRPRWNLFSRTVAFSNWGPSTPEAISPDGQRLERGGTVQGDMPPPARGCLRSDRPCAGRAGGGRRCRPVLRPGGACEAIGLVRVAQAGVAGAALARDVKKGVPAYDANKATTGRREDRHHRRSTARSGGYGSAGMRGTQHKRFSSPAGRCREG